MTTPLIGASRLNVDDTALFPLGTVILAGNSSYTYARAATAQAAAATTALTAGFDTTTGTTHTHDVAAPGIPAGKFYFARRVASAL